MMEPEPRRASARRFRARTAVRVPGCIDAALRPHWGRFAAGLL